MAEIVRMPKLSDTMTEGVVAKWHKKVGDHVNEGEVLAEIETDKATMEFESFQSGILLYRGVEEGQAMPVDSVLAIFGKKGEAFEDLIKNEKDGSPEPEEKKAEETKMEVKTTAVQAPPDVKAVVIKMPKLSDTMTEGVVAKWHKKIGDTVKSGDVLAEIETDKATMEFESYEDGTLLFIGVEESKSAEVDSVLAVIGEKGADYKTLIDHFNTAVHKTSEKPLTQESKQPEKTTVPTPATKTNGRIKASPLARKLAEEKGISLQIVPGSGEGGRIIKRDIENFSGMPGATVSAVEKHSDNGLSQMRKAIARRLGESKFSAPHFYLTISLDMDQAIAARKAINEQIEGKISFNDMVIKAVAMALTKNPKVNVSWMGESIRMYEHVHIGVAVAVEDGLIVPVIRHANGKSFEQIGNEVKRLAEMARDKSIQPSDLEGSTFTISNLGMFGIEEFTAIINPPNAAIMAIGGIRQEPVVREGQIVAGNVMKVTMSCDHRAIDGATGATFLNTFKQFLENPITMFI